MTTLHFSIIINAPVEKVWSTMLEDATYRKWTEPFHQGSYYEGNWDKGADIRFLGPDDAGGLGGMFSKIREYKKYEYISIEHLGVVKNGVNDTATAWSGAYENYTFKSIPQGTEVKIDLDMPEDDNEMQQMMGEMWPNALKKLKEIAERS